MAATPPGKGRGGLPGSWLLVGLLLVAGLPAALLWLGSSGGADVVAPQPGVRGSGPPPPPEQPDLDPSAFPELPGKGPIVVDLHYLGREEELPLRPVHGATLEGKVITPAGEPIAGARIRIRGGPQDGLLALSGADGGYWMPDLLPGTQLLEVEAGGVRVVREQRVLARGPTRRDLVVGPLMALAVRVRGADGRPMRDVEVHADLGERSTRTDADGVARLDVPRGPRVLVDVFAPRHVPTRHELNLMPSAPADGAPVDLPPLERAGVVAGRVATWPAGPLPRIVVVPRADRPGPTRVVWETWQGVEVDASGYFRLEGLPTTRMVDIRAFHPGGVCKPPLRAIRADPNHATAVRFVIQAETRRIAGRVLGPDGRPIPGARVVLEAHDPAAVLAALYPGLAEGPVSARLPVPAPLRRELRTGPGGDFDFAWGDHPEGSGTLVLTAGKEGYEPARAEVRVLRSSFTLRLEPERLDGRIRLARPGGAPLPDEVQWHLDGEPLARPAGLRRGRYEIQVRRGGRILLQDESLEVGPDTALVLR